MEALRAVARAQSQDHNTTNNHTYHPHNNPISDNSNLQPTDNNLPLDNLILLPSDNNNSQTHNAGPNPTQTASDMAALRALAFSSQNCLSPATPHTNEANTLTDYPNPGLQDLNASTPPPTNCFDGSRGGF